VQHPPLLADCWRAAPDGGTTARMHCDQTADKAKKTKRQYDETLAGQALREPRCRGHWVHHWLPGWKPAGASRSARLSTSACFANGSKLLGTGRDQFARCRNLQFPM